MCNTLQHTASHCNTWYHMQYTATHCNTSQCTHKFGERVMSQMVNNEQPHVLIDLNGFTDGGTFFCVCMHVYVYEHIYINTHANCHTQTKEREKEREREGAMKIYRDV